MKKILFTPIVVTLFYFLGFYFGGSVQAQDTMCAPNECSSVGKWTCNNGNMCCTGIGCPSWVCNMNYELRWENGRQMCCKDDDWREVCEPVYGWDCTGNGCDQWANWPNCYTETYSCTQEGCFLIFGVEWCFDYQTTCSRWTCDDNWFCVIPRCIQVQIGQTCEWQVVTEPCIIAMEPDPNDTCAYCAGDYVDGGGGDSWGPWSNCSVSCGGGIRSRVHSGTGEIQDQDCNTQACVVLDEVDIQGYIWNATGESCTNNPDSALEINVGSGDGDVDSDISVTLDGTTPGDWDPSGFSGYSYNFSAVPIGDHVITAGVPNPVGVPNSRYRLACVNDQAVGVAAIDAQTDPTTLHLGYKIITAGWFQSIDGDVFGGCNEANCANSISVSVPDPLDILGGFNEYLVSGVGTAFGDSGISVAGDGISEDDNRHLEYIASEAFWPKSFTFVPPSSAEEIADCSGMFSGNNLSGGTVYKGSNECIQDGLDGLNGNYNFVDDGIAVIYATGGDTITFDKEFHGSNNRRRIMIITDGPVEIGADFGEAAPTPAMGAHIEASIISAQNITFLSTGDSLDTTVIMEGPLVAKDGAVVFNRDRGLLNSYPGVVVKYNPLYLISLTEDYPAGITTVDISWVLGE